MRANLVVQDVEFHLFTMEPIPPARSEHYTHPPSHLLVIALALTCGWFLDVDPLHLCLLRPHFRLEAQDVVTIVLFEL